jgi:HSP20 family protein
MSETKNSAAPETSPAQTPEQEPVYAPRVDIREDRERFQIVADMPGVEQNAVDATVQNGVLTLEGWSRPERPQGYEPLGREFGASRFRRDFSLPDAADPARIQARIKQGVLVVTIPKREEVKARKIAITS